MKKVFLIGLLSFVYSLSEGQDQDLLFESSEFVWCGVDYSNVRCIGSIGFNEPYEIKHKYFDAWNELMLYEADKYDLKKAYDKTVQVTDLKVVERRNQLPDIDSFIINEDYKLEKSQIKEIIEDYDLGIKDSGLGLVFIMESLNKLKKEAVMYVVFFDISTKAILWGYRYTNDASGFGFRNYWARPIYETIKDSGKTFRSQKRKYMKSK